MVSFTSAVAWFYALRLGLVRNLAAREAEDATELAVRVSSAGFEFDGGRRRGLLGIGGPSSRPGSAGAGAGRPQWRRPGRW
jgi:hypothetical protein